MQLTCTIYILIYNIYQNTYCTYQINVSNISIYILPTGNNDEMERTKYIPIHLTNISNISSPGYDGEVEWAISEASELWLHWNHLCLDQVFDDTDIQNYENTKIWNY